MPAVGDTASKQPVKILRDTGASESLMIEGTLPLFEKMATGASVLLQSVGGFVKAPLHVVHRKSELISGTRYCRLAVNSSHIRSLFHFRI